MIIHPSNISSNQSWVRPADWLPIDHLVTNGEQKIVGLYAIFPTTETYFHNKVALVIRASGTSDFLVDWGDGTTNTYHDGVRSEHEYDYNAVSNSTLTTRGYKQAIITITPIGSTTIYSVYLGYVHTTQGSADDTSNWLDVKISGTNIQLLKFYSGTTINAKAILLEKLIVYQSTSTMTDISYLVADCVKLAYCDLNGLNTSNVTTLAYTFSNTSIKTLLFNTWNTGNCTSMVGMFFNSTYDIIDLSNFSTNSDKTVNLRDMFMMSVVNKVIFGALRIVAIQQMFYYSAIRELDFSRTIYINSSNTNNAFNGNQTYMSNLKAIDLSKFDATYITTMSTMFETCRVLSEAIFTLGYFTNCSIATGTFNASLLKKIRLPKFSLTFSVANNLLAAADINLLFGDLSDLGNATKYAISTYTINAAGTNYAVGDLITVTGGNNDAVLQVATLSGSGVATLRFYSSLGTGYSVASGLNTTTNGSGTGFKINITALKTAQTITVTGNPGAATCNTSIATNKGWTVVTA